MIIAIIIGARPQLVKAAMVWRTLKARQNAGKNARLIVADSGVIQKKPFFTRCYV